MPVAPRVASCKKCGTVKKDEQNHWWIVAEERCEPRGTTALELWQFSWQTWDAFEENAEVYCGESCVLAAVGEFLSKR